MTDPTDDPRDGRSPVVRWSLIGIGAIVLLIVLFTVVFPWIERNLSNPTLGG